MGGEFKDRRRVAKLPGDFGDRIYDLLLVWQGFHDGLVEETEKFPEEGQYRLSGLLWGQGRRIFAPKRKKREKSLPPLDAVLYVNKYKKSTALCQAKLLFCLSPLVSAAVLQVIS